MQKHSKRLCLSSLILKMFRSLFSLGHFSSAAKNFPRTRTYETARRLQTYWETCGTTGIRYQSPSVECRKKMAATRAIHNIVVQ